MLKYLSVILALTSISCGSVAASHLVYQPPATPTNHLVIGHNSFIEWMCYTDQANQDTALVKCKFHNHTSDSSLQEACLRVSYLTGVSREEVAHSNVIHSGAMRDDARNDTFVVFQHQPRQELLEICGMNASFCRLQVKEEACPKQ